ncbi:hypothetical protein [Clostridium pasteurianum]|uniref:hypothetical protein n=1 Tax=Clostridium pasteurianum TaxID=1501 RepID=UPI001586878B|nr:hypothetical protein [Clostridium pasteurianum]
MKKLEKHEKAKASYEKISGLEELKNRSDTIVEAEGTDKYELTYYRGINKKRN